MSDLGSYSYNQLASLVTAVLPRGVNAWVRNGVRFGIVQPFVSDIDLTIDCSRTDVAGTLAAMRRYRLLKKVIPLFGEANWLFADSHEFLRDHGNPLELGRDPDLLSRLGFAPRRATSFENGAFLLRMMIADLKNLRIRPETRRRKWERHFADAGLDLPTGALTLATLVEAMGDALRADSSFGSGKILPVLDADADSTTPDALLFSKYQSVAPWVLPRRWLNFGGRPEGFAWAIRAVLQMGEGEKRLLQSQLIWELSYLTLSEERIVSKEKVSEHAENVLILLRAAFDGFEVRQWAELLDSFSRVQILESARVERIRHLATWRKFPACVAPWVGVCLNPDSQLSLCELTRAPPVELQPGVSLRDHFHLEGYAQEREKMLRGELNELCSNCLDQEASGATSLRMDLTGLSGLCRGELDPAKPVLRRLAIAFGNECNLTCTTCSSRFSSAWEKRIGHVGSSGPGSWLERTGVRNALASALPEVREISISGGDPFLEPGHEEFLDLCISTGHASSIELSYTLCALSDPTRLFEKWKKFKKVVIAAWIDGFYEKEPYLRHPESIQGLVARLHLYDEAPGDVLVTTGYQVHALSIFYLPEFSGWLEAQGFKRIKRVEPFIDTLPDSSPFSIQNCPRELKKLIREKFARTNWDGFIARETIEHVLLRMDAREGEPGKVLRACALLDRVRGSSFARALPEIAGHFRD